MTSKTPTAPAKTATSDAQASGAVPDPVVIKITVQEFCERRSKKDRRVETLGAFYTEETKAGRVEDTEKAFADRLDAFSKKPI